jgi:hypothetical protein
MQSGANGRDPEYRPGRSRTRFDWVRVPQVRVCDERYSALAEKRDAFEALTGTAAALRPLATECQPAGWRKMRKLQGRISKSPIPDQKKVSPSRGAGGKFTSRPAEQSAPLANQEHWGPCRDWRHARSSLPLAGLRRSSTRCIGVRDQRRYAPRAEHLKFPEQRHGLRRTRAALQRGRSASSP